MMKYSNWLHLFGVEGMATYKVSKCIGISTWKWNVWQKTRTAQFTIGNETESAP